MYCFNFATVAKTFPRFNIDNNLSYLICKCFSCILQLFGDVARLVLSILWYWLFVAWYVLCLALTPISVRSSKF